MDSLFAGSGWESVELSMAIAGAILDLQLSPMIWDVLAIIVLRTPRESSRVPRKTFDYYVNRNG